MIIRPIVVGVHPNREERESVQLAVALSAQTGAPLEVVATYWFDSTPGRTVRKDFEARFMRQLDAVLADGAGGGRECGDVRITVDAGSAAHVLHETAERVQAALIVVGSGSGGPGGRIALGSTTAKVLDGAPCPVALAPRGYVDDGANPERIGVAFVDTREGRAALRGATAIARQTGATLVALTAPDGGSTAAWEEAAATLDQRLEELAGDVEHEGRVVEGGVQGLLAHTTELDVLVSGSRGYGPWKATVLGGVSRKLARNSACPLIAVPRGLDSPIADLFLPPLELAS